MNRYEEFLNNSIYSPIREDTVDMVLGKYAKTFSAHFNTVFGRASCNVETSVYTNIYVDGQQFFAFEIDVDAAESGHRIMPCETSIIERFIKQAEKWATIDNEFDTYVFGEHTFYIVKPNEYILWSEAACVIDLNNITKLIMGSTDTENKEEEDFV